MKKTLMIICSVLLAASVISCGKKQVKEEPKVEPDLPDPKVAIINTQNDQLAKIPVKGFAYKGSKVPEQEWDKWAETAAPVVKQVIDKLPEGYNLQVTGHADQVGPEEPLLSKKGKEVKPGNLKISTARAKAVYDALKKKGIDSPKLTFKGVGSSELTSDCDPKDACQRRVTFKVVPTESAK